MNVSRIAVGGLALLSVTLAGGWIATATHVRALRARLEQTAPAAPATVAATAKEKLLQRLLDERMAAYARLQAELETVKKAPAAPAAPPLAAPMRPGPNAGEDRNSWLERLRTEDPARYKQIQEEREQRRQRVEAMFRDQLTRLDDRFQAAQSQDEADLVNQIANTVARLDELRQQWEQLRNLPEEERRAQAPQLMAESRDTYQTLADLRARDRQLQLEQLAAQIGYRDQSGTSAFVESVERIYDETEVNPMRFMGFGGGGRGPPPTPPAQP